MYQCPPQRGNLPPKGAFETQHILVRAAVYLGPCLAFPCSRLSHRDRGARSPAHLFHILLFVSCANALQSTLVLITCLSWDLLFHGNPWKNPWALCLNSHTTIFQVTFSSLQRTWGVLSLAKVIAQVMDICRSVCVRIWESILTSVALLSGSPWRSLFPVLCFSLRICRKRYLIFLDEKQLAKP